MTPYVSVASREMTSSWPHGSKRRAVADLDSGTNTWVSTMAAIPTGMLIQKIARQLTALTRKPPSTGPSARLSPNTAAQMPSALARARRSVKVLLMIDSATGLSMDPPSACRARKATSAVTLVARLQSSDPAVNTARPVWNTRRRPKRSPIDPEAISRLPITSVYASTDHCSPLSEACSPRPMAGSATLTMVTSMPTTSRLMQQMHKMSQERRLLVDIYLFYFYNYCMSTTNGPARSVT